MEFLEDCERIAHLVHEGTSGLVGNPRGGAFIGIGADGTPTKKIDQVAENIVVEFITRAGLCRTLVSEELGRHYAGGERGTIFLDPIDGTFNAIAGIPFFALSIAYAEQGNVLKGYVKNLASGETFYAEKGRGAFCDQDPIHVSNTALLEECAMSVYGRKFDPTTVLQLGEKIRRWRLLGASALELCYVACGRLDGFIDVRGTLRVTDAAAGMLICEEAGGAVTDLEGNPLIFPDEVTVGRCMVASNSVIHNKVIEYLR